MSKAQRATNEQLVEAIEACVALAGRAIFQDIRNTAKRDSAAARYLSDVLAALAEKRADAPGVDT